MTIGILFLLLTGACWVGIGAVVDHAAKKKLDLDCILCMSSLFIGLAAAAVALYQQDFRGNILEKWFVILPVLLAGGMNYLMLIWMKRGMQLGHAGAVWGIVQSSLICPFIMGMCFFGVQPTAARIGGVLLILGGIAFFSRTKPQNNSAGYRWLLPTLGAFTFSGLAQSMANLPSYFQFVPLSSFVRCMLVQIGTIGAFAAVYAGKRKKLEFKGTFLPVTVLTAVQLLSLSCFFYNGLNLVAEAGAGSIGYPIAQGSCIVFFMLYENFFEGRKSPPAAWVAAFLLCAGIVALAVE